MDLSEQCGYSVEAQINLFASIKPLFSNKLVFLVINKIDITKVEDLDAETQEKLQGLLKSGEVEMLQLSCNTQEGVQDVKNAVCERLIAERVSQKLNAGTTSSGAIGGRLADVMSRIHVATPMGGQTLQTFIPEGVKNLKKYDKTDPERRRLARDVEEEQGGAGVFNVDLRADYILANPEWKYDKIPEIFDGKNVADFIDPDIEAKLAALEEEEEKLEAEGYYDSDEEIDDEEEATVLAQAELIREKQGQIRNEARMKKRLKNQAIIPRKKVPIPLSKMDDALDQLGVDTTDIVSRARSQSRPRGRSLGRSRAGTEDADAMDLDATPRERLRSQSRARSRSQAAVNRREDGVEDEGSRTKAERMAKLGQKKMNRMARQGEADRHTTASLQRHLVSDSCPIFRPLPFTNTRCSSPASVAWAPRGVVKQHFLLLLLEAGGLPLAHMDHHSWHLFRRGVWRVVVLLGTLPSQWLPALESSWPDIKMIMLFTTFGKEIDFCFIIAPWCCRVFRNLTTRVLARAASGLGSTTFPREKGSCHRQPVDVCREHARFRVGSARCKGQGLILVM